MDQSPVTQPAPVVQDPATPQPTATAAQTPPPVNHAQKQIPRWMITAGIVIGIIGVIVIISVMARPKTQPTVVAKPTPTSPIEPTVTPARRLAAVATTSAFVSLDQAVTTLKTSIAGYNPTDPGLSPPTLELPLGFSN